VDSEHRREDNEAEAKMKVKRTLQLSAIFFLPIGRGGEVVFVEIACRFYMCRGLPKS
jgi:hypothetical protein